MFLLHVATFFAVAVGQAVALPYLKKSSAEATNVERFDESRVSDATIATTARAAAAAAFNENGVTLVIDHENTDELHTAKTSEVADHRDNGAHWHAYDADHFRRRLGATLGTISWTSGGGGSLEGCEKFGIGNAPDASNCDSGCTPVEADGGCPNDPMCGSEPCGGASVWTTGGTFYYCSCGGSTTGGGTTGGGTTGGTGFEGAVCGRDGVDAACMGYKASCTDGKCVLAPCAWFDLNYGSGAVPYGWPLVGGSVDEVSCFLVAKRVACRIARVYHR